MKRMITSLLATIVLSGVATAQTLTIADVEAIPGEQVAFTLTIDVQGGTYSGFQFQMQFPAEGFTTNGTTVSSNWDGGSLGVGDLVAGTANGSASSMSDTAIPDGKQEIGTVKFTVAGTVPVGDYDVTVSGFNFLDGTNYTPVADVTFHVHVVNMHTVVLDETSPTAPEASDGAVNVKVKRTIKANEWSTICLPFAMTEAQVKATFGNDVQLANFTGYNIEEEGGDLVGINVSFANVTAMDANHPYLIKVSSPVNYAEGFTVDDVEIIPEDEPEINYGTSRKPKAFVGTYNVMNVPELCLFLSGNKFWYSTGNTVMKGFRGYFDFYDILTDVENSYDSRINFSFNEGTGITTNNRETITNNRYYDLQGRRVSVGAGDVPAHKGLYIRNGKKEIVK